MRELTYNKDGLLARLAVVYGPLKEWDTETDICAFWRAVVTGFLWCLIFTAVLGAIIGGILGDTIGWVFAMISVGVWVSPYDGALAFVTLTVALIALFTIGGGVYWIKRPLNRDQPPSFLIEAYISWKEKTCVKVTLK